MKTMLVWQPGQKIVPGSAKISELNGRLICEAELEEERAAVKPVDRTWLEEMPDTVTVEGGLRIETRARRVWLDEREVVLPSREFLLLCALAREPDRCYTKGELYHEVWGFVVLPIRNGKESSRTLDSHASRLRTNLDRRYVGNVWGTGYRLLPTSTSARQAAA